VKKLFTDVIAPMYSVACLVCLILMLTEKGARSDMCDWRPKTVFGMVSYVANWPARATLCALTKERDWFQ